MSSYDSRFERELKKRIAAEIEQLRDQLEIGSGITDYAKYQNCIGRLHAYNRVCIEFFPEVQTIIDKS